MGSVLIASDHAGLHLKAHLIGETSPLGVVFTDLGTHSTDSVDYPLFAKKLAENLCEAQKTETDARGVLVCGSGLGVCMSANRFSWVRAAACWDLASATLARRHNNANVLCLGERLIPWGLALDIFQVFLKTPFDGGRHERRLQQFC